ncbi:hypothetical protein FM21_30605 [Streptomyces mutabilis]|uniref:Uncharacterized protein n=1 Tax=Streptomyces mutabilis TaxID=67332 RepID=A0A086MSQ1_9ACTN|nr:hypothetical protein FM21_30605 [Streptomyces mutabilis]
MGYNAVLVALALCGVFLPAAPTALFCALRRAASGGAREVDAHGGHSGTEGDSKCRMWEPRGKP